MQPNSGLIQKLKFSMPPKQKLLEVLVFKILKGQLFFLFFLGLIACKKSWTTPQKTNKKQGGKIKVFEL